MGRTGGTKMKKIAAMIIFVFIIINLAVIMGCNTAGPTAPTPAWNPQAGTVTVVQTSTATATMPLGVITTPEYTPTMPLGVKTTPVYTATIDPTEQALKDALNALNAHYESQLNAINSMTRD